MKNHSSKAGVALIQSVYNTKSNHQHLIYPPANRTSHFVKIARIKNKEKRNTAMQKAARMYNIFETNTEVRNALPSLYDFSLWLTVHRNELSYSDIKRNIKGASLLTEAQEIFIWENVIYQIVENRSLPVKETLIGLLIANEFLKAIIEFNQKNEGYYGDIVFTEEQQRHSADCTNGRKGEDDLVGTSSPIKRLTVPRSRRGSRLDQPIRLTIRTTPTGRPDSKRRHPRTRTEP